MAMFLATIVELSVYLYILLIRRRMFAIAVVSCKIQRVELNHNVVLIDESLLFLNADCLIRVSRIIAIRI